MAKAVGAPRARQEAAHSRLSCKELRTLQWTCMLAVVGKPLERDSIRH
eukprot:CAMPEP_0179016548 /NCGR_PEP_ID=MMETSP0796-20121207/3377_1 /TAXON_ID=73915 /ORGANISM="Pyrodinium bahamense, Strain pbaha01" /LENGTH=47 /DNA_ID= /DNA_START= /DNA_END= /DNA_ORIENTATION=